MTGSMYAAIAGLRTHMQNLNVIGNNIANINTNSYKSGRSVFATSIYTQLSGGSDGTVVVGGRNPSQIGYGVSLKTVDVDMTTGNYAVTGKPTDCMLDGEGFFLVGTKDIANNFLGDADDVNRLTAFTLSRVGNFAFKADGYLTDGQGSVVYGFLCTGVYKEGDTIPEGKEVGDPIFSDQLVPIRVPRVAVSETGEVSIAYPTAGGTDAGAGAAANRLHDATGEDGEELSMAEFTGISYDSKTGLITGTSRDTGEVVKIACIAVGNVTNSEGLTQIGNSYYKVGPGSGALTVSILGGGAEELGLSYVNSSLANAAGGGGGEDRIDGLRIRTSDTELLGGGLEMSKTDLAQEIANMITTQRGYQANTRIVTVTDSMLEELVNMKR